MQKIVEITAIFELSHITEEDSADILDFKIDNPKGHGLEVYLKKHALEEERDNAARTYLIRDNATSEIVAYFTLKAGLITSKTSWKTFDNQTGVELANFAVNDNYRRYKDVMPHIGQYVFSQFVMKQIRKAQEIIGVEYLYIFALPEKKLIEHYQTMGFSRVQNIRLEKFIHKHIKPNYDKGCIFMYQKIV